MSEHIFDGLKVIDCASFIAGPAAATVMSDFGADVIKIEPPGMGDPYRRRAVPNPEKPLNPGFFFDARNKNSLALDLRTDAGRAVLYRLVESADVFITNYPPPARGRPGITYDDLKHLNERLIYASFSTIAWLNRNRRLAKDFETSIESALAWLLIASVKLLSRRLARA